MGQGYIGFPTACLIANNGFKVLGVDTNESIINAINNNELHIKEEKDLKEQFENAKSNLIFDVSPNYADIFIITVPTPFDKNKNPDLSYIFSALDAIGPFLESDNLIILESTSPIGTTEMMKKHIEKEYNLHNIFYSYCPERVLPGNIVYELQHNDRIIGGLSKKENELTFNFYSKFIKGKIHVTNAKTAEMSKLAENSFRDVNIAFANELSMICNEEGIDINEVIFIANKHPRVDILNPGIGVGGHCISVDPWFLISKFKNTDLLKTARLVNLQKTEWIYEDIVKNLKNNMTIGILGLTYKPNVSDIRESPAIEIIKKLKKEKYNLLIHDPLTSKKIDFTTVDFADLVNQSDLIIKLVNHDFYEEEENKKMIIKKKNLNYT